ncbi:hypothetical protein MND25_004727 [Vibrio parahaemolyticus]|nr:hypothetical protein [Vibrio parahaemolyticus]
MFQVSTLVVVASVILGVLLKSFLPAYFKEKAKNLATKEDIASITQAVEQVRLQHNRQLQELIHQNNVLLETHKMQNQLRLVVPDKRLQAHQEAFELWRKIISNLHSKERNAVVMECQLWYNQNCLYLSSDAREAFLLAYSALAMHGELVQDRTNPQAVKSNYLDMTNAGQIILKAVELPPLSGDTSVIKQGSSGELSIESVVSPEEHT